MTDARVSAGVAPEIAERHPDYVATVLVVEGIRSGLVVAAGDEAFETAAGGAPESPRPGEVVWRDDLGVTCRRWNWRQGSRTRLEEGSRRAFFVFDRLSGLTLGELEDAVDDLEERLRSGWPACVSERVVVGDA